MPIKYISLAGTTSGIATLIAPRLEVLGYSKFFFGYGYHILLTVYAKVERVLSETGMAAVLM